MEKQNILELAFVIMCIFVIMYFIYGILVPGSSPDKLNLKTEDTPILVVSVDSSEYQVEGGICSVVVNGSVTNIGDEPAEDTIVRCRPSIYPVVETDVQASKKVGEIGLTEKVDFEIEREIKCGQRLKFDCTAECEN